ncbi:MAG: hypothetical protein LBP33_06880 [Candidatus Adiutrix sp.]|jgi:hypothetical protein|nr:hypothetical protein [Candidatus Adiutrix sp.]
MCAKARISACFMAFLLTLMLAALMPAARLGADDAALMASEGPLTQADLDAYVYMLPKMAGQAGQDPQAAALLFKEAGLTRRRAAYIVAKITVTQALASGLVSTGQLHDDQVPAYLQPSTAELTLVNDNLASLVKAQEAARQAAASRGR